MIYLQLFWVYIQIGIFGFGGGYAMLSLIQNEVVYKYHWLTNQQFTDIVAVSQVTPGPIGINSATYIGYSVTGGSILGSLLATTAVMLPSFILCLIISRSFQAFRNNHYVDAAFLGIRQCRTHRSRRSDADDTARALDAPHAPRWYADHGG